MRAKILAILAIVAAMTVIALDGAVGRADVAQSVRRVAASADLP